VSRLAAKLRTLWRQQREASAERRATVTEIQSNPVFEAGLMQVVEDNNLDVASVRQEVARYLKEMVAVHNYALPDYSLLFARIWDRRGFEGVVRYDEAALERLRRLNEQSPLVVLIAHRSYSDFVVRVPFARHGFEREYRFAGANTNLGPAGALGHNLGQIYVRRGFRDPVYTYVLRRYVGWLAERKSSFLWPIEGTRTRTGKLLQPKMGLLAYLADAYVHGQATDVPLVPVAVIYEYLREVYEYAAYGRGAKKSAETPWLMFRLIREARAVPPEAKIWLGIGEPIYLSEFLDRKDANAGTADGAEDESISKGIARAAGEVCRRIDAVTPITAVALVLLPLLEHAHVSMSLDEMAHELDSTVRHIALRGLPAPEPDLGSTGNLRRALDLLRHQGLVIAEGAPGAERYAIFPNRHIEAAYYRNGIVHFFAMPAIIELALLRAARLDHENGSSDFWGEVGRLRRLLEGEFHFPEGDKFHQLIRELLTLYSTDYEQILAQPDGAGQLLARVEPRFAPRALAPFLEAYKIIADGLCRLSGKAVTDEQQFARDCLAEAQRNLAANLISRPDAVSLNLFDTPMRWSREEGLLADQPAGDHARRAFAAEVDDALQCVAALATQALSRERDAS